MRAGTLALCACLAGCAPALTRRLAPGLPKPLAERRARAISAVGYELTFRVRERIEGEARVRFTLSEAGEVALDFRAPADHLLHASVPHDFRGGHIVFAARAGENEAVFRFLVQETSVHREPDYLYSLFVPDRASEAFPCFDQPDLKASFRLTLDLPEGWTAVANAPESAREGSTIAFAPTVPLPTYLFAFAAGRFQVEEAERGGRRLRMFHRQEDAARLARNAPEIFDLHAQALAWLEGYTGQPLPFPKFDFALIGAFPYNGMEHPGAVFYRAERLDLDESATADDRLARAHVIAHECAHMWFGGLVTMRWFDDVWTKESFANLMADKIAQPRFPELDHPLRFLTAHAQAAYEVDRSRGAHALHQELPDLRAAGSLYGGLIYHKSPFVLGQLEELVGPNAFREGLRAALERHRFGNASWPELVAAIDARSPADAEAFSRAWVYRAGRPRVSVELRRAGGKVAELRLRQEGGVWNQRVALRLGERPEPLYVRLDAPAVPVPEAAGLPVPEFVLPNADGRAYGQFLLEEPARAALARKLPELRPALARGAAWELLYDEALEGRFPAPEFAALALRALPAEDNELILESLLGRRGKLIDVFWHYLTPAQREAAAPGLERALWERLSRAASPPLRALLLRGYRELAATRDAYARLQTVWRSPQRFPFISLSERELADLALALAARGVQPVERTLEEAAARIREPELAARFAFLRPAASPDPAERRRFFDGLRDPANRRKEPWVLDALELLHHPAGARGSEELIAPSLALLEELRRTNDIFFPESFLRATLRHHNSPAARAVVESFLKARKDLPRDLRLKVLQAADTLFRACAQRERR